MDARPEFEGQEGLIVVDGDELRQAYEVADRLEDRGGQVVQRYGRRVLVVDVPARAARGVAGLSAVRGYHRGALPRIPSKLDETERLGVRAWNLRQSAPYAAAKSERPLDGARWDSEQPSGALPPDGPGMEHVAGAEPVGTFLFDDMSPYLIGSVAVGLVIVEGPSADLRFSDAERTKVAAEVQEGLSWLGSREPKASATFAYDIRTVRIDAAPDPGLNGYEPLESRWRDPALAKLGVPGGMLGVREYVARIRRSLATRWGYMAFFTKYPVQHFAYALKPRLVMQYQNDGWGPDNIDRVFTHETGHIFGCPDEYAASNCSCTARAGYLREPNGNCERCAGSFTACLMAANTWAMCAHTPVHLGWRDTDGDGALDPVDPLGNPLVDLGMLCSTFPFICQLLGLSPPPPPRTGISAEIAGPAPAESVPLHLLRRVLDDEEMARVEAAVVAEQRRYLEAVERKLRAAADALRRQVPGAS
ncbi:MAG TPA: hypothetical protein VGQ47_01625 [Candidatus Limnocylindrales bacterium]|jgi:hypothetical protein|nr:hypothetical protein [Candidatus Limnocylindrales bacterium]